MLTSNEGVILPPDMRDPSLENGKLPDRLLVPFMSAEKPVDRQWRVHHQAFDNFTAFVAAAKRELNFDLVPIGGAPSAYRTYDRQVAMFTERYVKHGTNKPKTWNGFQWGLRSGMSQAATPGNSNHGLGLAIDFMHINGMPIRLDERVKLRPLGAPFEVVDTVSSENWHWVARNPAQVVGESPPIPDQPAVEPNPTGGQFRILSFGDSGPDVKYAQTVLRLKAGQTGITQLDGHYEMTTLDAVLSFQTFFGLGADGLVGPKTWGMIDFVDQHNQVANAA